MTILHDRPLAITLTLLFGVLIFSSLIGWGLARRVQSADGRDTVANLNAHSCRKVNGLNRRRGSRRRCGSCGSGRP